MTHRYKIRIYESKDGNQSLAAGTIVSPANRSLTVQAKSIDEVERRIRKEVADGKLESGRIYQMCPGIANPEAIRSVAVCDQAHTRRVMLEAVKGSYSEFRRIRYTAAAPSQASLAMHEEVVLA